MSRTIRISAEAAADWRVRAIIHTRGNASVPGAILLAILERRPTAGAWLGHAAVISTEGLILCARMEGDRMVNELVRVGTVAEVNGWMNRLADVLGLEDGERADLFAKLKAWVKKDFRAAAASRDSLNDLGLLTPGKTVH